MHARQLDVPPTTPPWPAHAAAPERTWLLLGDKPGDNAQVEALAEALGWPHERKVIGWRPPFATRKPRFEPSIDHVDPACLADLEPPWPDLILTIGRRPSMVALRIRERSAGRTKVVLLGKPSGMIERFDLVIAGAEVLVPPGPNVVPIDLPLTRLPPAEIEAAHARWAPRFAELPRPLVGILVGGPTIPFVYDRSVARGLVSVANAIAEDRGTPYVTTSRRTPPEIVAALAAELPTEARLFRWSADADDNPYLALLGLADGFVVTGDSISMMAEVARQRKPMAIFDLPLGRFGRVDQLRRRLMRWWFASDRGPLRAAAANLMNRAGLLGATRDFRAFHRMLRQRGLAVGADERLRAPTGPLPDDMRAVIARIRALVEHT